MKEKEDTKKEDETMEDETKEKETKKKEDKTNVMEQMIRKGSVSTSFILFLIFIKLK